MDVALSATTQCRSQRAAASPGWSRGLSTALATGLVALASAVWPAAAMAADEDLPGRVARLSEPNGEVLLASSENPEEWLPIGLNYPLTTGDNLWVGADGRAEVDFGGGQFRMAPGTNLQLSRLDDANFSVFVAQGRMILRIRVLEPGDTAVVDTPNAQIALTRAGLYRFEVSADRQQTQVAVREGEANVYAGNAIQQVLPGQTAAVNGFEPKYVAVSRSYGPDGFDTWSANRDRKYDRKGATTYVSRQMVGYSDLDEHGSWQTVPEYGPMWYPNNVAANWAPYRDGYWANVGAFGWTWVDVAPWGYAPFHYGRWAFIGGRWGWAPGTFVARPIWAPALVGWVGGPGWSVSVTHGGPVFGWVPLGWAEPYRPGWRNCSNRCWERYNRPYAVNVAERPANPPARFANWSVPGAVTAVPDSAFHSRRPINANVVAVTAPNAVSAPILAGAPLVRPSPTRLPGGRVAGEGAPPPASTFYPTTARPGGPSRGGPANTQPQQAERPGTAPGNAATTLPNRPGNAPMVRQSPNSIPASQTNSNLQNGTVNTFAPRSASPPGSPPPVNANAAPVPQPRQARQVPAVPPAPVVPNQSAQQLTRPSPTATPSAAPVMRGPPVPSAPVNQPPPAPNAGHYGGAPAEAKPQKLIRTQPGAPEGTPPAK